MVFDLGTIGNMQAGDVLLAVIVVLGFAAFAIASRKWGDGKWEKHMPPMTHTVKHVGESKEGEYGR